MKKINYLEKVPYIPDTINFEKHENGIVTLVIENKGMFNFIAQKLFKKPRFSYIHLDEKGSLVWPLIDGEKTVGEIAALLDGEFSDEGEALYAGVSKFFEILKSYNFVLFKKMQD